jgi:hypothetical protein
MAFSVPPMPNYVYVIIRVRVSQSDNYILGGPLCHHGVSEDFFPIDGLVEPNETLMGSAIRRCRHLVNYCGRPNDR